MNRFIGRKQELETLEKLHRSDKFELAVIYGRRRIGKSRLITEFIQDKKAIYYQASKVGTERNLELLTTETMQIIAPDLSNISFRTLEDLLDYIGHHTSKEKLILVIDEFPYWADKDESVMSVLQKYIDTKWADKKLLLILCGSSLSFMENKILSEKSPLFGRRSAQIRLEAFDYLESAEFVPNYTAEEKAICYGITGGVAKYLSLIDSKKKLDSNIVTHFFSRDGYLYDEVHNLLTQEFSDTTVVNNIIEEIAKGETTPSSIAINIHENDSTVLYSLNRLISVGIVEKHACMMEENNRKKVQYLLKDSMFRFWYTYLPSAISAVELGKGDVYYNKIVKPTLHHYMGNIFEKMCRHFTVLQGINGDLECFVTQVGNWWGNETVLQEDGRRTSIPAEVDVVGTSTSDRAMVIGECKFRNEAMDKGTYETLIRRGKAIPGKYPVVQYLLFSLGGFTDWVMENKSHNTRLYTLQDLYQEPSRSFRYSEGVL